MHRLALESKSILPESKHPEGKTLTTLKDYAAQQYGVAAPSQTGDCNIFEATAIAALIHVIKQEKFNSVFVKLFGEERSLDAEYIHAQLIGTYRDPACDISSFFFALIKDRWVQTVKEKAVQRFGYFEYDIADKYVLTIMSELLEQRIVVFSKISSAEKKYTQKTYGKKYSESIALVLDKEYFYLTPEKWIDKKPISSQAETYEEKKSIHKNASISFFNKIGDNPISHTFTLLTKDELLNISTVSKKWRELAKPYYWKLNQSYLSSKDKSEENDDTILSQKYKYDIPEKFVHCLKLINLRDKHISYTLNYFIMYCYGELESEQAFALEHKESADELTPAHYQVLEFIIKSDVQKFLDFVTENPTFNFNYLICFVSPLFLAEAFPNTVILNKLHEKNADLLPASSSIDKARYFTPSISIAKNRRSSPLAAEIISKTMSGIENLKFTFDYIHIMLYVLDEGIRKNQPLISVLNNLLDRGINFPSFEYVLDESSLYSLLKYADSPFGNHSADMLALAIDRGLYDLYLGPDTCLLFDAAAISIHFLELFFYKYPDICLNFISDEHDHFEKLLTESNPNCIPFLLSLRPDYKPKPHNKENVLHRLIERCQQLREFNFKKYLFCSDDTYYQETLRTVGNLIEGHVFLLAHKNTAQETPFLLAARLSLDHVIQQFIQKNACDFTQTDKNGNTALHLAIAGYSIQSFDNLNYTSPLDHTRWPTLYFLLQCEDLINAQNKFNLTAVDLLFYPLTLGDPIEDEKDYFSLKAIKLLLTHKNISENQLKRALEYLSKMPALEQPILLFLTEHSPFFPNIQFISDGRYNSLYQYALRKNYSELLTLLSKDLLNGQRMLLEVAKQKDASLADEPTHISAARITM